MTGLVAPRYLRWDNETPIAKQLIAVTGIGIAVIITYYLPPLGFARLGWLACGLGVLAASTVVAIAIGRLRSARRFESVVWTLDFLALFCLQLADGADVSPLLFVPVLLVLPYCARSSRRYLVLASVNSFLVLTVPAILDGGDAVRCAMGVFATIVTVQSGLVFHGVITAQRRSIARLKQSELERSNAERGFQGLWEAVTEQIMIATDLGGRIVSWNPGAERILGMSRLEVEHRYDIVDFHVPAEIDGFRSLIAAASNGNAQAGEWTYVRGDGSTLPVQLTVNPRLDEVGATIGYLFVAIDLTEAHAADKLKDHFVGLISHELRTPLSSVLGYLELLRDDDEVPLSSTQLTYLDTIERNANRLLRLVGDLMFTAQVRSGTIPLDDRPVDLAEIVAESCQTAAPAAAQAGVRLEVVSSDGILVDGDAMRLGQALDNLVSNAIKFTWKGGLVTVSLRESEGNAVVEVRDTGMGIPADEVDRLFSKFFRASTATRHAVQGVGLGLSITKAIATAHHGRVDVESEEGAGTSFSLVLPLSRVAVPELTIYR